MQALAISDEIRKGLLLLREPGLPDAERVLGVSRLVVATLRLVRKHLPGKHEQKTHGRQGSAGTAQDDDLEKTVRGLGVASVSISTDSRLRKTPAMMKALRKTIKKLAPVIKVAAADGGLKQFNVEVENPDNENTCTGVYDTMAQSLTIYTRSIANVAGMRDVSNDEQMEHTIAHELGHALDLGLLSTAPTKHFRGGLYGDYDEPKRSPDLTKRQGGFSVMLVGSDKHTTEVAQHWAKLLHAELSGNVALGKAATHVNAAYVMSSPDEMAAEMLATVMIGQRGGTYAYWSTHTPETLKMARKALKTLMSTKRPRSRR